MYYSLIIKLTVTYSFSVHDSGSLAQDATRDFRNLSLTDSEYGVNGGVYLSETKTRPSTANSDNQTTEQQTHHNFG